MIAEKEITIKKDIDLEIKDITLLSAEEYIEFKNKIKPINVWWWLRSPGFSSNFASCVGSGGSLYDYYYVNYTDGSVRPALIVQSKNLYCNDVFYLFDHKWTIISDNIALCDEDIGRCRFRKDINAKDANGYDASDIKKYLHNWLDNKVKESDNEK